MNIPNSLKYLYNTVSWPPYTVARKIYKVISGIEPGRFFEKHLAVQVTYTLVTNYLLFGLRNDLMKSFGKMDSYIFKTLPAANATDNDWNKFQSSSFAIIQPLLLYIGLKLVLRSIETLYDSWLDKKIQQKVTLKIFNEHQVGIKLANSEETAEIVRNLPGDIASISQTGLLLTRNMVQTTQNAALSFRYLNNLSSPISLLGVRVPDLILISFVYSLLKQLIAIPLAKKMAEVNSAVTIAEVRTSTIMNHDFSNVKPIFTAKAERSVAERHQTLLNRTNALIIKASLFAVVYDVWMSCNKYVNIIYKNMVVGYKVFTKTIKSEQIYEAWSHFDHVDNLISWPGENQAQIKNLEPQLDRVIKFLKEERAIIKQQKKVRYTQEGAGLSLRNLNLTLGGKPLVVIPGFTFSRGERYVISGVAGSGKSSLIAKINGIIHDGVEAQGSISFPAYVKRTMMLTQDDYFPLHATLLEVICLPGQVPTNLEQRKRLMSQAYDLLAEANLGREIDLEEEKTNWAAALSGGQKKKIKIVSAIMYEPDLLLLDEVFTGLDCESIKTIQDMILRRLPKTMIIAVDHHPDNSRDFYTSHHEIIDKVMSPKWGDGVSSVSRLERAREAKDEDSPYGMRHR